jgi:hypothetical protein
MLHGGGVWAVPENKKMDKSDIDHSIPIPPNSFLLKLNCKRF